MPTDTKGTYEDVWVVYVYLRPACSAMDLETHWSKFGTEFEALSSLETWRKDPRFIKADEIRKYKLYRLEGGK